MRKNQPIVVVLGCILTRFIYKVMAKEKELGRVSHWYDKINVAVVKLAGTLKKGDRLKFKHGEEEFEEEIGSLQIDHKEVVAGKKGDEIAMKLSHKAKEGTTVYEAE